MKILCMIINYLIIISSTVFGIGKIHEDIIQWWIKISEQKPLKCTLNPQYLKPFHELENSLMKDYKNTPIIVTRPREKKDTRNVENTFKGKIVNGQFEGPGRLKVKDTYNSNFPEGELQNLNKTCIIRNHMNGDIVTEAVGTFKNGMLKGPGKIKFVDNSTLISNFVNGIPIGNQPYMNYAIVFVFNGKCLILGLSHSRPKEIVESR